MRQPHGLTILVVGDPHGFAESLSPPLRADGHVVGHVPDGPRALAAARDLFPDVVFLDGDQAGLGLPAVVRGIGGLSQRRRPFFIALARRVVRERPPAAPRGGIDLYVAKPADTDRLRDLLRRFQSVVGDMESFDPVI
jgi:CheY-like chemotaxis protein